MTIPCRGISTAERLADPKGSVQVGGWSMIRPLRCRASEDGRQQIALPRTDCVRGQTGEQPGCEILARDGISSALTYIGQSL